MDSLESSEAANVVLDDVNLEILRWRIIFFSQVTDRIPLKMFAKKLSFKDNQHLLENLNKFKEEKALNFKIKDEIVSFLTVNHLAKTNIQDIKWLNL